ncbi:hypothetical protein EYF80_011651 [Liparis tanakae]|uniref:Uncharacterized protein n=1 Tax=Liparis tanakae TaxID=230148 RepID=A0A4Z2IJV1_9TELE|nr:hypothetical protein EYF80_011651 [Liparis tanakae]
MMPFTTSGLRWSHKACLHDNELRWKDRICFLRQHASSEKGGEDGGGGERRKMKMSSDVAVVMKREANDWRQEVEKRGRAERWRGGVGGVLFTLIKGLKKVSELDE